MSKTIKFSNLLAKVPAAEFSITNISFELYDQLGWALVEGELCVGPNATETAISITIPIQVAPDEIQALFNVVKVESARRRRSLK